MKEFLKEQARNYLIISFFIALDMGIIGVIFEPDASLGYDAFFAPPFYALLCTLPSFFMYSRKEMSVKRAVIGRILQIASIEAIILGAIKWQNPETEPLRFLIVGASVLCVFGAVWLVSFLQIRADSKELNEKLKKLSG